MIEKRPIPPVLSPVLPAGHLECEKPKQQSIGETVWHDFTYNGVNYAANLAISLVIWDFFTAGKGKVVKNMLHDGIEKSLISGGVQAGKAASYGDIASEMFFSPLGGHFMMIPVKYLEDHARYFTHRMNQTLDPKYKFKHIQANIDTPEGELPPLSDEPTKQTWGQIAIRRTLGWGTVIAAGTFLTKLRGGKYRKILQGETEDFVTWGMKSTNSKSLSNLAENATFKRYLNLFALDAYFTVITSGVTEATKSWFTKEKNGNGNGHSSVAESALPAAAEPDPSTPSPILAQAEQVVRPSRPDPSLDAEQALAKQTSFVNALERQDRGPEASYHPSV